MNRDPAVVAEGAMNRLCEGDVIPTARKFMQFQHSLFSLAIRRGFNRSKNYWIDKRYRRV